MRTDRRPDAPPLTQLTAYWAGRVDYQDAWQWQRRLEEARRAQRIGDVMVLLEHPHTYTIGRRGTRDHLLIDAAALDRLGAVCLEVDRGGDITYHGPGQLVGYPIIDLTRLGGDVTGYLRLLEGALIEALGRFGIAAGRLPGFTGVWVGQEKIAAIGVKVRSGITSHGFALNVATDLDFFRHIVPCGILDKGVTSMERLLATPPALPAMGEEVAGALGRALKRDVRWAPRMELDALLELHALAPALATA